MNEKSASRTWEVIMDLEQLLTGAHTSVWHLPRESKRNVVDEKWVTKVNTSRGPAGEGEP